MIRTTLRPKKDSLAISIPVCIVSQFHSGTRVKFVFYLRLISICKFINILLSELLILIFNVITY